MSNNLLDPCALSCLYCAKLDTKIETMESESFELASTSQSAIKLESPENSELSLNESLLQSNASDTVSRKRKVEFENPGNEMSGDSMCETPPTMRKHPRGVPHNPYSPLFDWQSSKQSLRDRAAYIFEHNLFCDVHFIVGEGLLAKRIPAHRFILSIGSAVFEAMFSREWSTETADIEVPDVEPAAFSALLRYLYTDDVVITADTVMAILYTAKKYVVPTLQNKCLDFLTSNLCPENAFTLLSQARAFDEKDLVRLCLEKIDVHAAEAFSSDCFTTVDLETLCLVAERNTLRIREVHLFEAVCRWSKAELARQNLPENKDNQCSVLERVLPLIRYPLMTSRELSVSVTPSGLLSSDQLVSLYSYLSVSPKPPISFKSTPRGSRLFRANRFKSVEMLPWAHQRNSVDAIGFRPDQDVWFMGFSLYGPVKAKPTTYSVSMTLVDTATKLVLFRDASPSQCKMDGSKTEYAYKRPPVKLKAGTNYTLKLNILGPKSCYGVGGCKDITINLKYGGQVTISFNSISSADCSQTTVECGQIPALLFFL